VLRSHSLGATDCRRPGDVLMALNAAFPMESHNDLYFTVWYGVYRRSTRRLSYGSAGHPPAILVPPQADAPQAVMLTSGDAMIGVFPGLAFETLHHDIPPGSRLFVFSDGVYEIERREGRMWPFEEFVEHLAQPPAPDQRDLDRLVSAARNLHGRPDFEDDFSVMRFEFQS
jgi:sigma-B regulation protein RsbU (phosphoserine phosphatase)